MSVYLQKIKEASEYLASKGVKQPEIGLILGSGLGELADEAESKLEIPYEEIPSFPVSTVEGHAGQLIYGVLGGKRVLAMQGRFHFYEGYSMKEVTFPVRVMKELGVHSLLVTNAAGGVNESFAQGDLMIINDHVNMMGSNPLLGANDGELGERFLDMSEAYDKNYQEIIRNTASKQDINMKEGVYLGLSGPTYETPAEIRMVRTLGGDAVGMSTVPEVIAAKHSKLRVGGISCITNLAAGMQETLNHEEVVETTNKVKGKFKKLVNEVISAI